MKMNDMTKQLATALRALKNPHNFRADPTVETLRERDRALRAAVRALEKYDAQQKVT